MSNAVLIFYGLSMLVAALRGYGGCEALAFSNWLLKRDDQLGCLVFSPIDNAERKLTGQISFVRQYDLSELPTVVLCFREFIELLTSHAK